MILQMFDYAKSWEGTGGKGHWPDCDMIQIGKLSKRGPVGPERFSRFTEDELFTHMNFLVPLSFTINAGWQPARKQGTGIEIVSNDEVLGVNQQGENPRQLYKKDGSMVWVSNVAGSKDLYVGLFNIADAAQEVSVDFVSLGLKGKPGRKRSLEKGRPWSI